MFTVCNRTKKIYTIIGKTTTALYLKAFTGITSIVPVDDYKKRFTATHEMI